MPVSSPDTFEFENPKKAAGLILSGLLVKSQATFRILAQWQLPLKTYFFLTPRPKMRGPKDLFDLAPKTIVGV